MEFWMETTSIAVDLRNEDREASKHEQLHIWAVSITSLIYLGLSLLILNVSMHKTESCGGEATLVIEWPVGSLKLVVGREFTPWKLPEVADQVLFVSLELFIATLNSIRLVLTDIWIEFYSPLSFGNIFKQPNTLSSLSLYFVLSSFFFYCPVRNTKAEVYDLSLQHLIHKKFSRCAYMSLILKTWSLLLIVFSYSLPFLFLWDLTFIYYKQHAPLSLVDIILHKTKERNYTQ